MARKHDFPELKAMNLYAVNTTGNGMNMPLLPFVPTSTTKQQVLTYIFKAIVYSMPSPINYSVINPNMSSSVLPP